MPSAEPSCCSCSSSPLSASGLACDEARCSICISNFFYANHIKSISVELGCEFGDVFYNILAAAGAIPSGSVFACMETHLQDC